MWGASKNTRYKHPVTFCMIVDAAKILETKGPENM